MSSSAAVKIVSYLGNPDEGFVPVSDADAPRDPDYIEGAIELSVFGVPILDQSLWDYVDQLWAYMCNMVEDLQAQDEVRTSFPDQPVRLALKRIGGGNILISTDWPPGGRRGTVSEAVFIGQLRESGREFFERMKHLIPQNAEAYDDALARLTSVCPGSRRS